ncbi:MAG TPA: Gfo/Idh/MocA family oxidoreductase [bacterium]|nr:Gfo/Idh/MocA family oxidoreductase [bacterium]
MKEKIKVAIVGSKFAADFHADSYRRNSKVDIVAVAAIDNLKEFSSRWNIPRTYEKYEEMLEKEDVDLVSVCVPNFLHYPVVMAAAAAGKNILCEKPLATNPQDARKMVETCRKKGVKLFYAEDWTFAPALRRATEVVHEGGIGQTLYVKAKECHNGTHSPFAQKKETCGGGSLIHLAIHPIGWILQFLGQQGKNKVVEVFAMCTGGGKDNFVHKNNGGEDFGMGMMKFADGKRAFVEGNYITVGGMNDIVEIYGTTGNVKIDLTFGSPVKVYSRNGYSYCIEKADTTQGWTWPAVDEFHNLGYVQELAYAVDCVAKDEKLIYGCSPELGLACVEIIAAMYESNEKGTVVRGEWG